MDEQTQAASSTAVVEAPSFDIPKAGTTEYAEWRMTGKVPDKQAPQPKPAESAAADTSEEATQTEPDKAKPAPGTEPGNPKQESRRKPGAEARIGELTAEVKQLKAQLEEARRPKQTTQAESSTAKPAPAQPQNYQEWRKAFKPQKWVEQYLTEHPQESYEDANAAMTDFMGDVRDQFRAVEQQRQTQANELNAKVADGRVRYGEKFDQVVWPTLNTIVGNAEVNPNVKAMFNDSEVITDLLYTIGSDQKTLNDFLAMAKTQPGKALRYLAVVEAGILDELAKNGKSGGKTDTGRNDKGQFTSKSEEDEPAPAKRGPENTPEPPIEINNRGGNSLDESERALKAIERGDANATRAWLRAENSKDLRRRRGA